MRFLVIVSVLALTGCGNPLSWEDYEPLRVGMKKVYTSKRSDGKNTVRYEDTREVTREDKESGFSYFLIKKTQTCLDGDCRLDKKAATLYFISKVVDADVYTIGMPSGTIPGSLVAAYEGSRAGQEITRKKLAPGMEVGGVKITGRESTCTALGTYDAFVGQSRSLPSAPKIWYANHIGEIRSSGGDMEITLTSFSDAPWAPWGKCDTFTIK